MTEFISATPKAGSTLCNNLSFNRTFNWCSSATENIIFSIPTIDTISSAQLAGGDPSPGSTRESYTKPVKISAEESQQPTVPLLKWAPGDLARCVAGGKVLEVTLDEEAKHKRSGVYDNAMSYSIIRTCSCQK